MRYLLAHDIGTSGDKVSIFSEEGRLIGSRTVPYPTYYDAPLYAEQNAEDWWSAFCEGTKGEIASSGISPEEIYALSFSGQMLGCLPVDREGNPLRRAIIWADQRAQRQSDLLREKIDDWHFYEINGHRNTPSYGIQKAMWVKENEPEVYDRTYLFLNAKDFIVWKLTGKFHTDCTDANSMGCFDQKKGTWSEEIVEASGIDYDRLPEIVPSTFCVGTVLPEAAAACGLSTSTKVIMGAGDGLAANIGAGSVEEGRAYCCLGTSAWVASTSEQQVLDRNMRVVCWAHAVPGLFSPNATMQYAGGSYSWLEKNLCGKEELEAEKSGRSVYDIMDGEIQSCPKGSDGLIFLPYLLGERAPRWNPDAKGVFCGITPTTERPQIIRSVMEGVFLNLGLCLDILNESSEIRNVVLIGGGARSASWQQCAADVFNRTIRVPKFLEEANSRGAAILAGVGSGLYHDFSAADRFLEISSERKPDPDAVLLYREERKQFDALYQALVPVFSQQ